MSTICLAAQRSNLTGEAVWFSYRLPSLNLLLVRTLASLFCLCALVVAGMYAHIYRDLRHPAPLPKPEPASVGTPDTRLSEMHYIYVSKPFPQPKPVAPLHQEPLPPRQDQPIMDNDADWQQAPDGDLSDTPLPGVQAENSEDQRLSLKARLMQALQEQQRDYSQGKVPDAPVDETQASVMEGDSVVHQTAAFKTQRDTASEEKRPPRIDTEGDPGQSTQ